MRHFTNIMYRVKSLITSLFVNTKSLTLNGTNQYMSVADDDSLSFGNGSTDSPFSVSAWINMNDATAFPVMAKGTFSVNGEWEFQVNGSDKLLFAVIDESKNKYIGRRTYSSITGYEGEWIHVAATYDGSRLSSGIRVYLNGIRVDNTNYQSGSYTATENLGSPLKIGTGTNGNPYADGKIDQPTIWDKELSIDEIKEAMILRDYTQHSAYGNIVSWWEFDDDDVSGATVSDRVGSNNGTLVNSPSRTTDIPYPLPADLYDSGNYENLSPFQNEQAEPFGGFSWEFDGVNEVIKVPQSASGDLHFTDGSSNDLPFSVVTWVKMSDATRFRAVNKQSTSGDMEYILGTNPSDHLYFILYNSSSQYRGIRTTSGINGYEGDWVMLTGTYDGSGTPLSGIKLYINSTEQVSTANISNSTYTSMQNSGADLSIGKYLTDYVEGNIGDTIIFGKELSSTEVSNIYNSGVPRDETEHSLSADIVGYWRGYNSRNTASGVLDQSGNGNHGTMTNMEDGDIVYDYPTA